MSTFARISNLDARLSTALQRNLAFASLRCEVQQQLRVTLARAFRRVRAIAAARHLRQSRIQRSTAHALHGRLMRGLSSWIADHVEWRRRSAAACRRARYVALYYGLRRLRSEAATVKRERRAAQRRAARQQRTLLVLHARLRLARWREEHGALLALVRTARRGTMRTARLRCWWVEWLQAATDAAALSEQTRRATVVAAAMATAAATDTWRGAASAIGRLRTLVCRGERARHRRNLARATSIWWRDAALGVAVTRAHGARRRRMQVAARTALAHWHQEAARRAHWVVVMASRVQMWRRATTARLLRRRLVRAIRSEGRRRAKRRVWRAWMTRLDSNSIIARAFVAAARRWDAARLCHLLCLWRHIVRRWRAVQKAARQLWMLRCRALGAEGLAAFKARLTFKRTGWRLAQRADVWAASIGLAAWRAASTCRRDAIASVRAACLRGRACWERNAKRAGVHAWAARARPLAAHARLDRFFTAARVWRAAARRLAVWAARAAHVRAVRAVAVAVARLVGGGAPRALRKWAGFAVVSRATAERARGIAHVLRRDAFCGVWRAWAQSEAVRAADVALSTGGVVARRLRAAWAHLVAAVETETAVRARLWATNLTLSTERTLRRMYRGLHGWRRWARAHSRARRWLSVGAGHAIFASQAEGLRRWRRTMRRYHAAATARPTPPRVHTSPLLPQHPLADSPFVVDSSSSPALPPSRSPLSSLPSAAWQPPLPPPTTAARYDRRPLPHFSSCPPPPCSQPPPQQRPPLRVAPPPVGPPPMLPSGAAGGAVGLDALLDQMVIMRSCMPVPAPARIGTAAPTSFAGAGPASISSAYPSSRPRGQDRAA